MTEGLYNSKFKILPLGQLHITFPAFTTFDAKEQQKPGDKQKVIMLHRPEQPSKCAEGQAAGGSAA